MIKRPEVDIVRKSSVSIVFELKDDDENIYDLSGFAAKFTTKEKITDAAVLTDDAGTIDVTNGTATVVITGTLLPMPVDENAHRILGELVLWSNGNTTTTPSHRIQAIVNVYREVRS